jgi:hypothetical protein
VSFDAARLYALLPEIHRIRDAEQGRPLEALLAVVADEIARLEENLEQLYQDQFVETCAPWVLPYLGDLVGVRALPSGGSPRLTPRGEVANTIGYRRRKGTAAMLEQLARDVTDWQARVVEFFDILATTQHLQHLRPRNRAWLSVRDAARLENLGGAFEHLEGARDLSHNVDVRSVRTGAGRYGISNVGIFLWRLHAQPLTCAPAVADPSDPKRRFRFHPLGIDAPLVTLPDTEDELARLADPSSVPCRISRRALDRALSGEADEDWLYGRSLRLETFDSRPGAPVVIGRERVVAADLSSWTRRLPARGATFFVDPVLGRILSSDALAQPPRVLFHVGEAGELGGGEYERGTSLEPPRPGTTLARVDAAAFAADPAAAFIDDTVELSDSGRADLPAGLVVPTRPAVELRAGNKHRPTILLGAPLTVAGGLGGAVTLDGLLLTGAGVHVTGNLRLLRLRHCTIVPGLVLDPMDRRGLLAGSPALVVESPDTVVEIDHCVVGPLHVHEDAVLRVASSVVDACEDTGVAIAGPTGSGAGAALTITNSTVFGKVYTAELTLASNTIFASRRAHDDAWSASVLARRRQTGCVRYSFVPADAIVPRRHRCQPAGDDAGLWPTFESTRYGEPGYALLASDAAAEIRRGADDESEMGAFHDVYAPLREDHLRARLDEYLRFGLDAGVFYVA